MQQRATRSQAQTPGASIAGPRQAGLSTLSATLNAALPVQRLAAMAPANPRGLPTQLKRGLEAMSGLALDDVRVHRNSSQPAQLNALAYAQGRDIRLGPGQERHLPHEAWHVVQQAQGRVAPTRQMKRGVAINDELALEREADVMGARTGAAMAAPVAAGMEAQTATSPPAQLRAVDRAAPIQLLVAPMDRPVVAQPRNPRFAAVAGHEFDHGIESIDWVPVATGIYNLIAQTRLNLPEDAETATETLLNLENAADILVTRANANVATFDATVAYNRVAIINSLHQDRADLIQLLAELQENFAISEGGFGAKGRATAVDDVRVEKDYEGDDAVDNSFIDNISINGQNLTARNSVIKPAVDPAPGAQRLMLNGVVRSGNRPNNFIDTLTAPVSPQQVNNLAQFVGADRGRGQEAAMNGTNARGYAWATNTAGWNTTQWEWLHIRGASLGGATAPTNLVLGARDANTHMIPFESNLKALATVARDNPDFTGVSATWSIGGEVRRHSWSRIVITWRLNKAATAPAELEEPHGTAQFSPLAAGNVLSKDEVQFLEDALREARPHEADDDEVLDDAEVIEDDDAVLEDVQPVAEEDHDAVLDTGEGNNVDMKG